MKTLIIDGQGGRLGSLITEKIKSSAELSCCELYAIGTNSIATAAMLKAGADYGATGENPVVVGCRDADFIIGPIGIVCADALFGEVTEKMAAAIGRSSAEKLLIPVNKCKLHVAGENTEKSLARLAEEAVELLKALI